VLLSSPILASDRGIPEEAMGDNRPEPSANNLGSGNDFDVFGVDPSLDPELAMVCIRALKGLGKKFMILPGSQDVDARSTSTCGGRAIIRVSARC
jgi:hypothetical protein